MKFLQRIFLFFLAAFNITGAAAQQKFTGVLEYSIHYFGKEDKETNPSKMTIAYGGDKIVFRALFKNNRREMIVINAQNDSLYLTESEGMTYSREAISSTEMNVEMERTDSTKNYFGYTCRGYRVGSKDEIKGYLWVADDFEAFTMKDSYKKSMLKYYGLPHVLMGLETYDEGQRNGNMVVESVTLMDRVPDSLFDLSAYKPAGNPARFEEHSQPAVADTGIKMEMPVEAVADSTMAVYDTAMIMVDTAAYYPPKKPVRSTRKKTPVKKLAYPPKAAATKPKH